MAFALCGRGHAAGDDVLLVYEVIPIRYDQCPVRLPDRVTWRTGALEPVLERAAGRRMAIAKFHSHPTGWPAFSPADNASDRDLFPSVYGWVDDEGPHASVVMLPDGRMFGRSIDLQNGFRPLSRVAVVGHDVLIHDHEPVDEVPVHAERHLQVFGRATTALLGRLRIGVVGCSGTGSIVVEQLARLGARGLVLVDPDHVEWRNLNRIVGATREDAERRANKVDVLARSVGSMGLGVDVMAIPENLASRGAVEALSRCDVLFGCMDSHDGRRMLNRLASYYVLPYIDVGVSLEADGHGGVNQVCAAAHYVQPGRSTLLSRRVIVAGAADAEAIKRSDPAQYARLRAEKYIDGVTEDRPAVISVNVIAAGLGVNELLARVHPFRDSPNSHAASTRFSISQLELYLDGEGAPCPSLARHVGRGDVEPRLDMPYLSARAGGGGLAS